MRESHRFVCRWAARADTEVPFFRLVGISKGRVVMAITVRHISHRSLKSCHSRTEEVTSHANGRAKVATSEFIKICWANRCGCEGFVFY